MNESKTKKVSQLKIKTKEKTKKEEQKQVIAEEKKGYMIKRKHSIENKIYCSKNLKHSFNVFNENNKSKFQNSKT